MAERSAIVCSLDQIAYSPTWSLQEALKEGMVQDKRSSDPSFPPHLLLLLEHPPVYTLGKSGDDSNLLLKEDALSAFGAEFHRIDRGGDITYHGPGQMVGYFILDLDRIFRDLHRYMRSLEEVIIRTLADYGLTGSRVNKRTGVWVGPPGFERKICALGIRCSRWVTMHGIAFNVNTDLSYYQHIIPCGINDRSVTSIAEELHTEIDEFEVRLRVAQHFGDVFELDTDFLTGDSAYSLLETRSGMTHLQQALAPLSLSPI